MPKSIAEMRQSPAVGLPETTHEICVAGKLQSELRRVDAEMIELKSRAEALAEQAGKKSPRLTDKAPASDLWPQVEALAERADEIRDEMFDHMATLTLRAHENGTWRQWCLEHPARPDEVRDQRTMSGFCNADDLVATIGDYVIAINGEEPQPGDWDFIAANAAPAALLDAARKILELHETVVNLGKSRRAWLSDRTTESASSSPSPSASASAG